MFRRELRRQRLPGQVDHRVDFRQRLSINGAGLGIPADGGVVTGLVITALG